MNAPPAVLQTRYTFRILKTKRSRSCEAPSIRFSPRGLGGHRRKNALSFFRKNRARANQESKERFSSVWVFDRASIDVLGYWEHFVPLQRGFAECELP